MGKKIDFKPGEKILVSRTDRLGDLILALPFAETMKLRYPECRIDVIASLYASPILEHNPRIDGIMRVQNDMLLKDKLYKKDFLHKVRMAGYSAVIALFPERRLSHLFHKAGIPMRFGTAGRFHSALFSHRLFHSRKANKKHESEYNMDFFTFFKDGESVHKPRVYLQEKELNNAQRVLREAGVGEDFVLLHPGGGGSAERWPMDRFVALYGAIRSTGVDAVFSGSDMEGENIETAAGRLGVDVKKITGGTDLRTLAAVLSLSQVVVANSTGPLHLAAAVGTRTVGLYPSKRVMSPLRWGPLGDDDIVLQGLRERCTCPGNQCKCMESITIDTVASAVTNLYMKGTA